MASLQVLSLSSNLLEELPEAVAGLHSLRQLFANGNRIKKVPENLCLLPDLKVRGSACMYDSLIVLPTLKSFCVNFLISLL